MSDGSLDSAAGKTLAERVARAMFARDRAAQAMGIEVLAVGEGYARVAMSVTEAMLNGHDICHGGYVFALADTAFAYACNSRNERNVALQCTISFAAAARAGERLEAVAEERTQGGRTGTFDVTVSGPERTVVALFRGTNYRVSGALV
ncbi:MAG TPA: hydroxyphenylacetyl-CoA thioesterase PaaI [Candidatus Baltobacteraceae bacterium]|nr:hydroxyphenylacetyl-CoA thioesterase PaaI [Candidatus Baltobacteraceae bacterium]